MKFKTIYLEIGNKCNLQCSFCPPVERAVTYMEPNRFRTILEKIAQHTEQITLHLMGEPFAHPEILAIIAEGSRQKIPLNMTTNGILLRKIHYEPLFNSSMRQINFSLQSFYDNFPRRDPKPYLKRILDFVTLAEIVRPDLYVNFRLWDLNHLEEPTSSPGLEIRRIIENHYQIDFGSLKVNIKRRKGYKVRGRIYVNFDSRFEWPSLNGPSLGEQGKCYGLIDQIGILADGTVVPCCLDKEGILKLGNIHKQSLEEIVKTERSEKIRSGFRSGILHESLCQRCSFVRRFSRRLPKNMP